MERLTETIHGKGFCRLAGACEMTCETSCKDCETLFEIFNKLADYEEAEEQGLLLRLPCKEGAEVYEVRETISGTHKRMGTVQRFEIINGNILVTTTIGMFNAREFGKTVFLAESEGAE